MKNLITSPDTKVWSFRAVSLIFLVLMLSILTGCAALGNVIGGKVLAQELSEPLAGATAARFDIYAGSGNLTIDPLSSSDQLLASGTLQYQENLGQPARTLESSNGQANLTLKWGENSAPCTAAIEWLLHINPTISSEIDARSGGGNVSLNLAGMVVTRVSAETGGGNMDLVLPENTAHLSVTAKTGAGNVVVSVPSGTAAKIHATTGLGKMIIDSRFTKIDENTYQSPDYESAANKVEITAGSGAGNVEVKTR